MQTRQERRPVTIEAINARSDARFAAMAARIKTETDTRIFWTVGSMGLFSLGLVAFVALL